MGFFAVDGSRYCAGESVSNSWTCGTEINPKLFRFLFFLLVDVIGITRFAKLVRRRGTNGLVPCFRFRIDVGRDDDTELGANGLDPSGDPLDPLSLGEGVRVANDAMAEKRAREGGTDGRANGRLGPEGRL